VSPRSGDAAPVQELAARAPQERVARCKGAEAAGLDASFVPVSRDGRDGAGPRPEILIVLGSDGGSIQDDVDVEVLAALAGELLQLMDARA
jgi:hypothetical protein